MCETPAEREQDSFEELCVPKTSLKQGIGSVRFMLLDKWLWLQLGEWIEGTRLGWVGEAGDTLSRRQIGGEQIREANEVTYFKSRLNRTC